MIEPLAASIRFVDLEITMGSTACAAAASLFRQQVKQSLPFQIERQQRG